MVVVVVVVVVVVRHHLSGRSPACRRRRLFLRESTAKRLRHLTPSFYKHTP
jgi:hypothetical protein